MDLGIAGRKAIVCGSSRGLGRACAEALLREGVEVVLNVRDEGVLQALAAELTQQTGTKATGAAADLNTQEGRDILLAACPEPDILVNNNGEPSFKDFRELDRAALEK